MMNILTRTATLSLLMLSTQCSNYYEDSLAPIDISIENINIKKVKEFDLDINYLRFTFAVDNTDDGKNIQLKLPQFASKKIYCIRTTGRNKKA